MPVEALYDRARAHDVILRNLLQRQGYDDLEAVRSEGQLQSLRRSIAAVLDARGLAPRASSVKTIEACRDPEQLEAWLKRAATADDADQVFRV